MADLSLSQSLYALTGARRARIGRARRASCTHVLTSKTGNRNDCTFSYIYNFPNDLPAETLENLGEYVSMTESSLFLAVARKDQSITL